VHDAPWVSAEEPVIHREEVVAVMFMLADAVEHLDQIRRLLGEDEEEAEG
jgi:hypothetical protein